MDNIMLEQRLFKINNMRNGKNETIGSMSLSVSRFIRELVQRLKCCIDITSTLAQPLEAEPASPG